MGELQQLLLQTLFAMDGTTAKVKVEKKEGAFVISLIELETEGTVPGIDEATFRAQAETAKVNCPVSKALAGAEIRLAGVRFTAG